MLSVAAVFVRRTGTHRAQSDVTEVATRRVRRLGGLDPPPTDRGKEARTDALGDARVPQGSAPGSSPPRGGWVPARDGRPEATQGIEPVPGPEPKSGPEPVRGPEPTQTASTEVTVHDLRALAAARDNVADRLPVRLGLTGGHVAIIAFVLVVAIVAASVLVWRSRPVASAVSPIGSTADAQPPDAQPPGGARPDGKGAASATSPAAGVGPAADSADAPDSGGASAPEATLSATVVVHVAGKVARPGVVEVAADARVADAIEAAGGVLPGVDLQTVNLARLVTDGEQVLVGLPPEEGAPTPHGGLPGGEAGNTNEEEAGDAQPIDLNTATIEQLETLPGVGPVLAQRMLDYRDEQGAFGAVDELLDVSGIGEVTFADLEPLVTVG